MKIEAVQGANINQLPTAQSAVPAGPSPRERAIAKLIGSAPAQAEQPVVRDATRVSPEESTAVRPPSLQPSETKGQIDSTEGNPSEVKADTKTSEEPLSAHYAILARKEKAIRQRDQQLKAREAAIKAQEDAAKLTPPTPSFDQSKFVDKERLTQDPFAVLSELGLSYDQLTELAMNAPKPEQLAVLNEMKALKAEIAAMKGETKKSFEQQAQEQRNQAITQIRNEVKHLITNDVQFETIKATDSIDDVVSLIEKVYDKDGILLSVEEAAQQVEDYLIDEAIKIAKLSKIQQRLQPKPAEVKTPTDAEKQPLKTLTNSIASSRQLSARERALLAFENKLK